MENHEAIPFTGSLNKSSHENSDSGFVHHLSLPPSPLRYLNHIEKRLWDVEQKILLADEQKKLLVSQVSYYKTKISDLQHDLKIRRQISSRDANDVDRLKRALAHMKHEACTQYKRNLEMMIGGDSGSEKTTDSVCRTSRSEENPGRRFWGCGNYDRDSCKVCHFFEWVDPDVLVGANVVLQRLERKIEDQSKEIKLLKKFVLFLICVELIKLLLY
ncbi:hypothetical protein CsatB_018860 [Cannabis sativa]